MFHKKTLFSIALLTAIGTTYSRVVERQEDEAEVHVTVPMQTIENQAKDRFFKPFITDVYKADVTGKFASSSDSNYRSSLLSDVKNPFNKNVDQYFASKVKLDIVGNIVYESGAEVQVGFRAKSVLGNPRAYNTTKQFIKLNEALVGEHSHMLETRVFYMREAWMNLEMSKALGTTLSFNNFKIGMFGFEVGRGISFGENYAVSPASLGFYSDSSVDMYAPGALLNGTLFSDKLEYDMYVALLTDKATNLTETGAFIYEQLITDKQYATSFARGFGRINYVFVSRLKWTPINDKVLGDKIYLEPYIVYNSVPEQKVEFIGDARSTLVTFGLAGELATSGYELGFEGAFNRGHQDVYAWDRNMVTIATDSTTGAVKQVYSKVYDELALTNKTVFIGDTFIYRPAGDVSSNLNGKEIGLTGKYNAKDRFRDAYRNNYKGWMIVGDVSKDLYKNDLKLSMTAGITSGDVNSNTDKTGSVREYKGFIPLQELYYGKRVKSYFVMGPTSSLARPHALSNDKDFNSPIEGFSNLKFIGAGLTYKPEEASHSYCINPNILMFWQDHPSLKLGSSTEYASNDLGLEFNLFTFVNLIENVKVFAMGAIFKPLQHYKDLAGTQLTVQKAELLTLAAAGIEENLPTLSDRPAYSMSCGIECLF